MKTLGKVYNLAEWRKKKVTQPADDPVCAAGTCVNNMTGYMPLDDLKRLHAASNEEMAALVMLGTQKTAARLIQIAPLEYRLTEQERIEFIETRLLAFKTLKMAIDFVLRTTTKTIWCPEELHRLSHLFQDHPSNPSPEWDQEQEG